MTFGFSRHGLILITLFSLKLDSDKKWFKTQNSILNILWYQRSQKWVYQVEQENVISFKASEQKWCINLRRGYTKTKCPQEPGLTCMFWIYILLLSKAHLERNFNPLCTSCATMILSKLIVIKKGERRADFLSLMPKAAVFREWKLCDADSQYIPIII